MSQTRATVIRGARLLDIPGHRAEPGDVLIEGDTVREIGAPGLAAPAEARVLDASGKLLMPGLVNAHTHGHGALARGMGDRWNLELLLNAGPWISGGRTLEDKALSARLNAAEMVRRGCTAAYDLYFEIPLPTAEGMRAVGEAYAEVGMRVVLAPMSADRLLYEAVDGLLDALPGPLRERVNKVRAAPYQESLAVSKALLEGWSFDRALVAPALAPTIPLHCSDEYMTACRDLAAEHGVGLHMHLAESKTQAVSGIRRYGKTLTAHLDDLGLLGPGFTGAHSIWLTPEDIARLGDRGASIAHNPGSNLRLGNGIAAVREMIAAGVNVGIGTDGSNCSDNQNLFEAMRLASFVSRIRTLEVERWLGTEEVLTLATAGGAKALGYADSLGRLAPGYKADLVFLNLADLNYVPFNDPTNQIVHCEAGNGVDSVMIGGRMVLENGRFTTLDEAKLRREAAAAAERLWAATAESKALAFKLQDYVAQHCMGLARQPYPIDRFAADALH